MSATAATDPRHAIREVMQAMWSGVAPAWDAYSEHVDARSAALTEVMLDAARIVPGARVLELAGGAGGLGLAAAARVGPEGEVLITDVADTMTAIAARRVAAAGLVNVRTAVMGVEFVDAPDASFDAVLCREGLMFAVEPARALAEIARVLRPGGRMVTATWGRPAANPWLAIVMDSAAAQLGEPVPPPGVPGPFALSDAGEILDLVRDAGLVDVEIRAVDVPLVTDSFADWWDKRVALAGPLATRLAALSPEGVAAMQTRAREAAEPFARPGGYEFPGVCLVAIARRP
jgi:ubiquinone/menaquinone biosynthesis C-methylase UbiE